MRTIILLLVVFFQLTTISAQKKLYLDKKTPIDERINLLMEQMSIEEKVGQMNQYNGFWDVTGPTPTKGDTKTKYNNLRNGLVGSMLNVRGVKNVRALQRIAVEETRLGIPLIIGFDIIHGYKTLSPIPLAEAASWDLEAIKKSVQVAANEASASGINWAFGPMIDVSRDARWGRVMEGSGEDPFLGSKIAEVRIKGFQGDNKEDLSKENTIASCAKHFAGYGFVESGRDYNTVDISNSTLYNVILPPFKAAKDAGVCSFMNSFNVLNGVPATGNSFLQRTILKGKWGFDGFVVSDWGSIKEMKNHGFAKDDIDATEKAILAGVDMDMESHYYVSELVDLVKSGRIEQSLVDDAVKRILRVKFDLGLFDDPYKYCNENREKLIVGSKQNNDVVLDIAKKSIVLLKNDNNLLPLKKTGLKIALIGSLASDKTSSLGSWRFASEDNSAVSVLEGMQKYKSNNLIFEKGADLTIGDTNFVHEIVFNTTDRTGFENAKNAAINSDVVVIVLGEHGFQSGESRSRTDLGLPGLQQELLEEIYKVNPNIVLVLNNGRPLVIPWAVDKIPAIIEAWQLGTQSGNAIAQVLYGDYNPSGKLPMSFPRNVGQCPIYYNHNNTGRPINEEDNVFWSHYSDVENTPQFPFGFGLSYTTFDYKNLKINKLDFDKSEEVQVSIEITNSGNYDGKEVVQLYIQDLVASIVRPVKELKGFQLVDLKKGETKIINFNLSEKELGFFDSNGNYILESGTFKIMVGGSSDKGLEAQFELK